MENTIIHYRCSQQWLYGIKGNYAILCDCTVAHDLEADVITFTIETAEPAAVKLFNSNSFYLKAN
jgi:hypothetical protein